MHWIIRYNLKHKILYRYCVMGAQQWRKLNRVCYIHFNTGKYTGTQNISKSVMLHWFLAKTAQILHWSGQNVHRYYNDPRQKSTDSLIIGKHICYPDPRQKCALIIAKSAQICRSLATHTQLDKSAQMLWSSAMLPWF